MKVAVTWECCGFVDVPNASTIEEAMEKVRQNPDNYDLPSQYDYVDGSFELSTDDPEIMASMCECTI